MNEALLIAGPLATGGLPALAVAIARVGGLFVAAPVLGDVAVSFSIRAAAALVVSVLAVPVVLATGVPLPDTIGGLVPVLVLEALVGLSIGFAAHAFLAGAEFAGGLMGYQAGLEFSRVVDPVSGRQISLAGSLQRIVAVAIFVILGGPSMLLAAVFASYDTLAPGAGAMSAAFAQEAIAVSARLLVFGLQVAAPALAATVIADLVLVLIGRAVPQIQILIVGYPLKMGAGIIGIGLSLGFFIPTARPAFLRIADDAGRLVHALAR